MKNSSGRVDKKIVALIIEIALILISSIVVLVLDGIHKQINVFIWVAIYSVLIFALVLTLSLIKYTRLREIRRGFKETNLPLYTDQTALMGHDIIDEDKNHESVNS